MFIRSALRIADPPVATRPSTSLSARLHDLFRRARTDHLHPGPDSTETELLVAVASAERRIVDLEDEVARLRRIAMTDELTGLLNRRGFQYELGRALGLARRHGEGGALLIIDLDGFKLINDSFGHAAGDAVLRHVAALLAANVRATDVVARLGGDEFAVLMLRSTAEGALSRTKALGRLLNASLAMYDGQVISIRASVGCELYGPGSDLEALVARADADMYRRKRSHAAVASLARSVAASRQALCPCGEDRE